ncbi:ENTH domain-containing protein [Mycena venus]|uniref:ENTH domain-containing protein n=1 Tax=Mycena venus TaxID=2733690 RepID=A0A8H6XYC2_9AGAR|nr:ENTH domain-containing protein [Mycena venus]
MQYYGKGAIRQIKNRRYSDTQAKVRDATSNDPWGPSGTQMNEIAQMTYNQGDFVEIMEMLDKRLNDKGKNWRHVFKSLTLLDYLLHQGSENVIIYFKDNLIGGGDVRTKAKDITSLLQDEGRLRTERRARASMRERMVKGPGEKGEFDAAARGDENSLQRDGGRQSEEMREAIVATTASLRQKQLAAEPKDLDELRKEQARMLMEYNRLREEQIRAREIEDIVSSNPRTPDATIDPALQSASITAHRPDVQGPLLRLRPPSSAANPEAPEPSDTSSTAESPPASPAEHIADRTTLPAELAQWRHFAEKGGIGKCTAISDCLEVESQDLMFLKNDEIVVLAKFPDENLFFGYCDGVVGRFHADDVHFHPQPLDNINGLLASWERRRPLLEMTKMDYPILSSAELHEKLEYVEAQIGTFLIHILNSQDDWCAAQRLQASDAQSFIDAVQDVLDRGMLPDAKCRSKARRLVQKISEAGEQLPTSLFITGVDDRDEHPTFGGGFGDVYRASYQGRMVALKRIRIFTADSTTYRNRLQFCKEALVWQGLRHRFILPLLGIDRETFSPSFCMVSPWMKYGTVLKYLRDRGRGDVDRFLVEIAQGLDYLHSINIVHDLSYNTLTLTQTDYAVLRTIFHVEISPVIWPLTLVYPASAVARIHSVCCRHCYHLLLLAVALLLRLSAVFSS